MAYIEAQVSEEELAAIKAARYYTCPKCGAEEASIRTTGPIPGG